MITLRKILKSSDSDYYARFKEIESSVISVMSNSRFFFPTYTNHDFKHLTNIENIINDMLTEEIKKDLSDEEIFCLLSAAWLHDIGMIPVNNEKDEYDSMTLEERKIFAEKVRLNHNIRSKCYVENHKEELKLDDFSTKKVIEVLNNLGANKKALIVLDTVDKKAIKSSNNIPGVKTTQVNTLNVYDMLNTDKLIILKDAVSKIEEVYA